MTLLQQSRLDGKEHVEFLLLNPSEFQFHWVKFIGLFNRVGGLPCPVGLRQLGIMTFIRPIDVILDSGDEAGNRIPRDPLFLFHRWERAAQFGPATCERIRRKILRPFLLIREIILEHQHAA